MVEGLGDKRVKIDLSESRKYVTKTIDKGVVWDRWKFYRGALDADVLINMPVAKTHGAAKVTLGLKNMIGVLGGVRQKIHTNIHQGIVDINTAVKSHLTIVDATRVMIANGPTGGDPEDLEIHNTVLASSDIVAVDAHCVRTYFNSTPEEVEYVRIAQKTGLGNCDPDKIEVVNA